jgi:hypothetical protein
LPAQKIKKTKTFGDSLEFRQKFACAPKIYRKIEKFENQSQKFFSPKKQKTKTLTKLKTE